jgi:hypothetical protein
MKTIFDKITREELVNRINMLHGDCIAEWGKMNIYQMVKHCTLFEEMVLGRKKYKQAFIGRLFGKIALKSFIGDERPLKRNSPTVPEFIVTENGNVIPVIEQWIALIQEYEQFANPGFVHPFFGKMTKEQIGYLVYKHTDHHLRQFNS